MEIHSCPPHIQILIQVQNWTASILTYISLPQKMYVLWRIHEFMYEGAVEGRGSGAALRSLVDLGLSLGGGPGGEAPGS